MPELCTEVLIVGGGLSGVATALAACQPGRQAVLTEETDWVGGQLAAQAVPPDEHPWIEQFGCTASHRELRTSPASCRIAPGSPGWGDGVERLM
jgi:NADPH-dependent 2,4-dienoyl-CoA reductase/sulfur reductase-like enzyme